MRIRNHRLVGADGELVPYRASPNRGGALTPRFLVMHFTAGASAQSSIEHLCNRRSSAAAHLVIGRDGSITQLVPFNRVAWHAGRSRWQGISGLNQHSIGIELDNAGELRPTSGGWESWFGREIPDTEVFLGSHKNGPYGSESGWHRYPEEQIEAAMAASSAIVERYSLQDVLGHDDIAPLRKRDPGPAFPLQEFASALIGRSENDEQTYRTTARLNIREGPGVEFETLEDSPLAVGTRLTAIERHGHWFYVEVLGDEAVRESTGWVHGDYIAPA
ncbi:MAG: N-acetylmuramoyl-L-alanine amidase [Pseudomonadota bacterium]